MKKQFALSSGRQGWEENKGSESPGEEKSRELGQGRGHPRLEPSMAPASHLKGERVGTTPAPAKGVFQSKPPLLRPSRAASCSPP